MAEKRLEMLSQLSQKEVDEAIANEQSTANLLGVSGKNFAEEGRNKIRSAHTMHGLDEICTGYDLPGSEETIRRASPEHGIRPKLSRIMRKEGF
jgi:hypothetical protein